MSIQISNVTRRVVYAASGTGPYNFTFEVLNNTDVAVYRDDTLLTLTTNYTVTINANGTGFVTLTAAPTGATQIAIVGNRNIQRTTDFVTGGDFFANTLNDELDQQTIFAQQNAEGLQRALSAPQTDPTSINMTLPRAVVRAGRYMAFDNTGNPTIATDISVVYQGAKASNPAVRNDGTALQTGDIYFNTGLNELRLYTGSAWVGAVGNPAAVDVQTFNSSGTWNKPAGVHTMARIQVWGGGGGGAGSVSSNSHGAGGGGGYNEATVPISYLDSSVSVTVGPGGAGSSTSNGDNGGTSFVNLLTAWNGLTVISATGGQGGRGSSATGGYGGGPVGVSGVPTIAQGSTAMGAAGSSSQDGQGGIFHGGGGGSPISSTQKGGSSIWGGGGGGAAPNVSGGTSVWGGNGGVGGGLVPSPGIAPGGGGGSSNIGGVRGGDGGYGRVIITAY